MAFDPRVWNPNAAPLQPPMRKLTPAPKGVIMPPGMRPVQQPQGTQNTMWNGYDTVARMPAKPSLDRDLYRIPTMEREPESFPPNSPIWINTNCPPWVCPPFWSENVDESFSHCVPTYEQGRLLALSSDPSVLSITIPQDYCLVITGFSYEALNGVQGDVFTFDFLIDGTIKMKHEDIVIDATQPNPAHRYALAGHTRQIKTHLVVDRNHTLSILGTLRGPIDFAGNSPYFPGQPITSGDCQMKLMIQGWLANLRENVDGAPRPTDLGDGGNILGDEVQARGGYP